MKKLYRSNNNRTISGVLGGLGEYFDVDPTILRLVYLFFTIFSGIVPGTLFYLFAVTLIPNAPHGVGHRNTQASESAAESASASASAAKKTAHKEKDSDKEDKEKDEK